MSETLEKDKKIDEEEEEFVLLELNDCLYSDIPPGAPFVLSGLDTLTPTLIVGNGLKMLGEYEETVGTCYLFSESEAQPKPPSDEAPPSEVNTNKPASSSKEAPVKEVNHLASVQKVLKFRPVNGEHL
ncbi:hypothetical protein BS78_06G168000 [Paspalum vaginatum]|nr:hypothetical protein BS78_06G168000 [Paspalum vaginatum]